jgi:hypothetical protein
VQAIAIFPFILVQEQQPSEILINHEYIHFKQQIELLIIPFYCWYLFEYLLNRFHGQNHHQAYLNICFEKEAYENEEDLNYLARRRAWAYWKRKKI